MGSDVWILLLLLLCFCSEKVGGGVMKSLAWILCTMDVKVLLSHLLTYLFTC